MEYVREDLRAEYNSIKHGLRVTHGSFGLAIGLQEEQGVPAPIDKMKTLFSSNDGSHFLVADPIPNGTKKTRRQQFLIKRQSVGWELERVIGEIQIISMILNNLVSALIIHQGVSARTVRFVRPEDAEEFWKQLLAYQNDDISNFSYGAAFTPLTDTLDAAKEAAAYYRDLKLPRSS